MNKAFVLVQEAFLSYTWILSLNKLLSHYLTALFKEEHVRIYQKGCFSAESFKIGVRI